MRLAALTLGAGVPAKDFAGRIEEVHARACLIALSDGSLLTLLAAGLGSLPRGITLDAPPGFCFRPLLVVGAAAAARGGVLRAGALTVDLRRARPWRCDLDGLHLDLGRAPSLLAWQAVWSAWHKDSRGDGLFRLFGAAIDELSAATCCLDAAAAQPALFRLIGLGEGRTPAGDDFLVGYIAGLWACGAGMASRAAFVPDLGRRLRAGLPQTNRVSRVYLEAAADGQVSERLFSLAAGIAVGDGGAAGRAVSAALAVGHSSGAAGVLGLLRGCAAWSGDAEAPPAVCGADAEPRIVSPAHASAETVPPAAAWALPSRSATPRQIAPSSA